MELAPTGVIGRVIQEHEQKRPKSLEELGEPKSCLNPVHCCCCTHRSESVHLLLLVQQYGITEDDPAI